MTREEIKELLPIMQAWTDGKAIQFRRKETVEWVDLYEDDLRVSPAYHYRIKPEPKYRPFKSQEECWTEMLKHQPFGWVRSKKCKDLLWNVASINKDDIAIICDCYKSR